MRPRHCLDVCVHRLISTQTENNILFIGKTHPEFTNAKDWEEIAHRATEAALLPKIYTRVTKLYEWKCV